MLHDADTQGSIDEPSHLAPSSPGAPSEYALSEIKSREIASIVLEACDSDLETYSSLPLTEKKKCMAKNVGPSLVALAFVLTHPTAISAAGPQGYLVFQDAVSEGALTELVSRHHPVYRDVLSRAKTSAVGSQVARMVEEQRCEKVGQQEEFEACVASVSQHEDD